VVANQIEAARRKNRANPGVQPFGMALMAQFVDRLMGDYAIEPPETFRPVWFLEAALNKLGSLCQHSQTVFRKLVHGGRKIQQNAGDIAQFFQQTLSQESGAGAQFKNSFD